MSIKKLTAGPAARVIVVAVVAVLLGCGAAIFWRASRTEYDVSSTELPKIKAAHAWFAAAPTVPANDPSQIIEVVIRADLLEEQPEAFTPGADMQESLARMLATWLRFRADANADEYIQWMRSRGYVFSLSHPEGRRHYSMHDRDLRNAWKLYTGKEAPDDLNAIDPEQFFRIAFTRSLELKDAYHRPVYVSTRVQIAYMAIPITRVDPRPVGLDDWPEADFWEGNSVSGDRPHWVAPITYSEVLQRDRVALAAVVFVAGRSASGHWTPMSIACYHDLATGEWHIESVSYSNSLRRGIAIER